MRVILDIEANGLTNPDKIWCVVCKDIDTGKVYIFRDFDESFINFILSCSLVVGHNIIGYDLLVLQNLLQIHVDISRVVDTLIVSKLTNYSRPNGHSLEAYGEEFGIVKEHAKVKQEFFKQWSQELEDRCVSDVEINYLLYLSLQHVLSDPLWLPSIEREQRFQGVVNSLRSNGFAYNTARANVLLKEVQDELASLDKEIQNAFPPKLKCIKVVEPKLTKYGTLNRSDFRWLEGGDLSEYNGGAFCRCVWREFNASSHKQIIEVLSSAGWKPTDKTETHKDTERELNRLKSRSYAKRGVDITSLSAKMIELVKYGWKINENNLSTLPPSAPAPARTLAKRIIYESRRRTLVEWLNLVQFRIEIRKDSFGETGISELNEIQNTWKEKDNNVSAGIQSNLKNVKESCIESGTSNTITDYRSKIFLDWLKSKKVNVEFATENANCLWITIIGQQKLEDFCATLATQTLDGTNYVNLKYKIISERIYSHFQGIGAWTHRMAHQSPNVANIPNEFKEDGTKKFLGKELRSLWIAPRGRLLVGVDAEGIQLRLFAHYVNDKELIESLVNGSKSNRTDPHSLNQRVLGKICKTRQAAKRFLYALFLGGGIGKFAEILGCRKEEAEEAVDKFLERYPGFSELRQRVFPNDAKRGYFIGLDGRKVPIPGATEGDRRHLAMSGYLQNGEKIIMSEAAIQFEPELVKYDSMLVDLVHDEFQAETPNDMKIALQVAELMSNAIKVAGETLKLNCPMQGSYWNEDKKDYTIGKTWYTTH
jgi:DNA polymerase I-like protein with 3'-5' exonuclease and polymerase domains